ncbi:MAG: cytochrome c biogenesis protein ResB [Planctomycetota bacterium]|jgi:hypothetical protein
MKTVFRKICMTISLMAMLFWTVMSIYGAFLGAEKAKSFFNAPAMIVFWSILLILMLLGFGAYPALRKRTGLMLIHAGCCLVVAGGMFGSTKGHEVMSQITSKSLLMKGFMAIGRGQVTHLVEPEIEGGERFELDFAIHLKDAFIEYYDEATIQVQFSNDQIVHIPTESGQSYAISDEIGVVSIAKVYKNLKIRRENGEMVPYDDPSPGANPAYEVVLERPDGTMESQMVFVMFPMMHGMRHSTFNAQYSPPQMVKDYKSTLQVIEADGQVAAEQTIEVNKPLYYGGYHFYQNTFSYNENGPVSGIMVTSVRGVWTVFAGYGLIFVGMMMHFWFGVLRRKPVAANGNDSGKEASDVFPD